MDYLRKESINRINEQEISIIGVKVVRVEIGNRKSEGRERSNSIREREIEEINGNDEWIGGQIERSSGSDGVDE